MPFRRRAPVDLELQSRLSITDIRAILLRYTFDGEQFTLVPEHKGALAELRAREAKPSPGTPRRAS
jgi:hypothetical protein